MSNLARMSSLTLPVPAPIAWQPDLAGEYAGQQSFIEVGAPPARLIFCWCPPTPQGSSFVIGSPSDERGRGSNETQRKVNIPHGFWIAQHPVNQQQWRAVMGSNPSQHGKEDLHPVDSVSWNDAQKFCHKTGLRLPREEEWEYACRAGSRMPFGIGEGSCLNSQLANFDGSNPYGSGREAFNWLYRQRTVSQGSFPPNAWGMHDMHGQLLEWCEDEYSGWARVLRGGCWLYVGEIARSALRYSSVPGNRNGFLGFRPCPSSTRDKSKAEGRQRNAQREKE